MYHNNNQNLFVTYYGWFHVNKDCSWNVFTTLPKNQNIWNLRLTRFIFYKLSYKSYFIEMYTSMLHTFRRRTYWMSHRQPRLYRHLASGHPAKYCISQAILISNHLKFSGAILEQNLIRFNQNLLDVYHVLSKITPMQHFPFDNQLVLCAR